MAIDTYTSPADYIKKTTRLFQDRETAGGLALIAATIIALLLGNSQWAHTYHHFLEDELLFEFGDHFGFGLKAEKWINDGLMAIFFLVAGLELKREIMVGELSTLKKASMPLMGALGGMVVPALIFVALNIGEKSISGWGVPMATDIAYSLGIIGLLGKRIPSQLKIFLVALAIADDLGAILVIAFFYSHGISWLYLGAAAGIFVILLLCNRLGAKSMWWYVPLGIGLWFCFLHSGVHATIAGVLFALTIPVKPKLDSAAYKERMTDNLKALEHAKTHEQSPLENPKHRKLLRAIKRDTNASRPPLLKLENRLVGFNAFFIIPVFALANAGVKLDVGLVEVLTQSLGLGIILGLAVGKVLGIGLFAYAGERLGFAERHPSLSYQHIIGMGFIAGIGFTMSLFITNLAFTDAALVKVAKISILLASLAAAVAGIVVLMLAGKKSTGED
ncbi:Na+/H+ antiporter NhaA [Marinoscillum furvescens]|uniref:Na(+)/H(+) antiporter NhaA n=1 Tax=Marinoscillum furvescens DSM 4134 TaxID=1122208 RepID=A0A3D9L1I3_MARFU|nr:Na+/H+ antiporter NhaA [Marinoscillum furvescens]RED96957.1 sodium/proton antiporter (NhaA family) [Marinoscillum furvescens DSM 4134]